MSHNRTTEPAFPMQAVTTYTHSVMCMPEITERLVQPNESSHGARPLGHFGRRRRTSNTPATLPSLPCSAHRQTHPEPAHGLPGEPARRRAVRFLHLPAPSDRMDALRSFMG